MTVSASSMAYGAIIFATGVGIPVMAALNAHLGARIESPNGAALILFVVAFSVAAVGVLMTGVPTRESLGNVPVGYFGGGLLVAFYVLSITWLAPRIGVGNAIFLVLLGQLGSAAAIDHFGAFGATPSPLSWRRGIGLMFMLVGVCLARQFR